MADATVKCISVGKKDAVFNKWRLAVLENGERALAFTIKKALLAYVLEQKFIDLGCIHFDPETDKVNGRKTVNIILDDTPDLIKWVELLEKENLKSSKVFKEIIVNCIRIVPQDQEEHIPRYYDFVMAASNNNLASIPTLCKNEQPIIPTVIEPKRVEEKPNIGTSVLIGNKKSETATKNSSQGNKPDNNIIGKINIGNKR